MEGGGGREQDRRWLERAVELARRGLGRVEPNPPVGAVCVREGVCVGEGWHERFGAAHAERRALERAGAAARGATLYVSLEPCSHHGKTPPCTEAIIAHGCARVVYACPDPHPAAAGGSAVLARAGIEVHQLPLASAQHLLAPFLTRVQHGRPWVIAKWAMTLDGRIATRAGHARWISSSASRLRVHERRAQVDAVVVGIGTALSDDPLLTVRLPEGHVVRGATGRPPLRVVVDSRARLPLESRLVRTATETPLLVAVGESAAAARRVAALEAAGCEVVALPQAGDRVELAALLAHLARRGERTPASRREDPRAPWPATRVLVEGGAAIHGSLFDAGLADEVEVFVAPRIVGGEAAPGPVGGRGVERMEQALALETWDWEQVGVDLWLRGRVHRSRSVPSGGCPS